MLSGWGSVVEPGDTIAGSLKMTARTSTSQTWLLILNDQTRDLSWSKSVSYRSSLKSAEWIAEAPYSGAILPLANYGTMTFDSGTINRRRRPISRPPMAF
jgi:hypothetical protein